MDNILDYKIPSTNGVDFDVDYIEIKGHRHRVLKDPMGRHGLPWDHRRAGETSPTGSGVCVPSRTWIQVILS